MHRPCDGEMRFLEIWHRRTRLSPPLPPPIHTGTIRPSPNQSNQCSSRWHRIGQDGMKYVWSCFTRIYKEIGWMAMDSCHKELRLTGPAADSALVCPDYDPVLFIASAKLNHFLPQQHNRALVTCDITSPPQSVTGASAGADGPFSRGLSARPGPARIPSASSQPLGARGYPLPLVRTENGRGGLVAQPLLHSLHSPRLVAQPLKLTPLEHLIRLQPCPPLLSPVHGARAAPRRSRRACRALRRSPARPHSFARCPRAVCEARLPNSPPGPPPGQAALPAAGPQLSPAPGPGCALRVAERQRSIPEPGLRPGSRPWRARHHAPRRAPGSGPRWDAPRPRSLYLFHRRSANSDLCPA